MKFRSLEKTNINCPIIGFGAAPLGDLFQNLSEKKAQKLLQQAQSHNITFYDTSPFYGYGLSEKRLGEHFKNLERDSFIVSTKVGRYLIPEDPTKIDRGTFKGGLNYKPIIDYSYDGVMRSFEQSLKRLNVDHLDICLIHDVDHFTHGDQTEQYFKEALKGAYVALQRLKDQKLVKAIGLGLNDADMASRFIETKSFDCVLLAGRYTLLDQSAANTFLDLAQNREVGIILGGVFNSGILAKGTIGSSYFYQSIPKKIKKKYAMIKDLCVKYKVPVPAAAIQFCLRHPAVTSVILGMDETAQIKENIAYSNHPIADDFWEEFRKLN